GAPADTWKLQAVVALDPHALLRVDREDDAPRVERLRVEDGLRADVHGQIDDTEHLTALRLEADELRRVGAGRRLRRAPGDTQVNGPRDARVDEEDPLDEHAGSKLAAEALLERLA